MLLTLIKITSWTPTHLFILQEESIQYHHIFLQLLNNLFKVNSDHLLYDNVISFFATRKCQKFKKKKKKADENS